MCVVFVHTHIGIVLLALVIWGRGIRLKHQLLDGALEERKKEKKRRMRRRRVPCYVAW